MMSVLSSAPRRVLGESTPGTWMDQVPRHLLLSPTVARADWTHEDFLEEGPGGCGRHREGAIRECEPKSSTTTLSGAEEPGLAWIGCLSRPITASVSSALSENKPGLELAASLSLCHGRAEQISFFLYCAPYPSLLPPEHRPVTLNIQQLTQRSCKKPEARARDVAENKMGVVFPTWPENYHTVKL